MAARNQAKRWVRRNVLPLPAQAGTRDYTVPVRTVRSVLEALASFLGDDGYATATYAQIAGRAGCGRRAAIRTLLAAEKNGYILMTRFRAGKIQPPNRYVFQAVKGRHGTCQRVSP